MNNSSVVNIQDFINSHRVSRFQWIIFGLCFVIVLLDGFDTAAIGYIAPSLLSEWGLRKADLAPVLSSALFGLAFGAIITGPMSDRFGRRYLLVGSVALFGLSSILAAFSSSIEELRLLRFVTGVGLGAAMPNAVTMMSEYCPDNRRATLMNLMFCGFPLGAGLGGLLAAWMIPNFGWRSILLLGGILPLIVGFLIVAKMPESVRFMVANKRPVAIVRMILSRISPSAFHAKVFELKEPVVSAGRRGIGVVVARDYIIGTLMLWIAYFMGLVVFYGSINWMPTLLNDVGIDAKSAMLISALFPLGGVGAVLSGVLMDKLTGNRVVAACYGLTAISVYCIGQAAGSVGLLVVVVFLAGVMMNTAQCSMPALAAVFYPTSGRGTGVALMLGFGRFGGIAGSFLVAELARRQFSFSSIFACVAVAGIVAALALLMMRPVQAPAGATHNDDGSLHRSETEGEHA
jgi:AAHS family 4-hydroxybenzoate transporter-like MFS transporter